ncbi:hypothetical protein [Rubrobacter aplysinae]|uniref:hypothetical protein n=1 Tax=Rubrobacter aplysinae TaxID=909625 RepID=UPI00064BBE79|nr:hypothetical protein [Rubrobacter aplysinae]
MKKISRLILAALLVSAVIDLAGFAFGLFYAGVFYDNLAHFLTTFSLVALAAELYLRYEMNHRGVRRRVTAGRALALGAALGLIGGASWEGVEAVLDLAFPATIYNPAVDSAVDVMFGVAGGALGVWRTAIHFGLASPYSL